MIDSSKPRLKSCNNQVYTDNSSDYHDTLDKSSFQIEVLICINFQHGNISYEVIANKAIILLLQRNPIKLLLLFSCLL